MTHFPPPFAARETARGLELDPEAGFKEAARTGDRIRITGVIPTHRGRVMGGDDVRAQTHFALDRVEGAMQSLGAELADLVRIDARAREEDWPGAKAVLLERLPPVGADSMVRDHYVGGLRPTTSHRVEIGLRAQVR